MGLVLLILNGESLQQLKGCIFLKTFVFYTSYNVVIGVPYVLYKVSEIYFIWPEMDPFSVTYVYCFDILTDY